MSEEIVQKIIRALEATLADLVIADHIDVLNALTSIIIETLKTNECLTKRVAYERIIGCFTEHVRKHLPGRPTLKRPSSVAKFAAYQKRQRLVALRSVKRRGQP
jgi:hypothetical protein